MLLTVKGLIYEKDYKDRDDDMLFVGEHDEPLLLWLKDKIESKSVSVRYWLSKDELSKKDLETYTVLKMLGMADVEFFPWYGEYTGYITTKTDLKIGGHDLLAELENAMGNYLYMEIEINE